MIGKTNYQKLQIGFGMNGYRNNFRIIYSNDGLMFKTDSHYNRFIAIE